MRGTCSRGTVLEINLDPVVGSEADKSRPCVVVQNDIGNRYSPITIVVAITGAENVARKYPVDVSVAKGEGGLTKDSIIQCNQIRSVDEKQFVRTLGRLSSQTMDQVDKALKISLAL
jgi:mRNA interferase MazF